MTLHKPPPRLWGTLLGGKTILAKRKVAKRKIQWHLCTLVAGSELGLASMLTR